MFGIASLGFVLLLIDDWQLMMQVNICQSFCQSFAAAFLPKYFTAKVLYCMVYMYVVKYVEKEYVDGKKPRCESVTCIYRQ